MALKDGIVKAGVGLGLVAFVIILITTALPYWRVSDHVASDPFMSQINSVEGLWIRCTATYQEYYSCDWYDTALLGLPAYINGFRALMVVATIASFSAFLMSVFGLSCLQAIDDESRNKRLLVLAAGSVQIVAGLLTCLCVSWYASEVIREYHDPLYAESRPIKYTFGSCLYLGWIGSVLSLAAGILMLCCHLGQGDDDRGMYKPTSRGIPMTNQQRPFPPNNAPIYTKNQSKGSQEYRHSRNYDQQDRSYDSRRYQEKIPTNHDGYV